MTAMSAMAAPAIEEQLEHLPDWHYENDSIVRRFTCNTFIDALNLVQKVGYLAEQINHHPDITLNYNSVSFRYWTHSAGGVTTKDIEAARQVEHLIISRVISYA